MLSAPDGNMLNMTRLIIITEAFFYSALAEDMESI
jgi:hypothetical protein